MQFVRSFVMGGRPLCLRRCEAYFAVAGGQRGVRVFLQAFLLTDQRSAIYLPRFSSILPTADISCAPTQFGVNIEPENVVLQHDSAGIARILPKEVRCPRCARVDRPAR